MPADALARKDHRHFFLIYRQCSGNFRTDKTASNHCKSVSFIGQGAKPPVVAERSEIDDLLSSERQLPRGAACGQEQLFPRISITFVVTSAFPLHVKTGDLMPEMRPHILVFAFPPNRIKRIPLPKPL